MDERGIPWIQDDRRVHLASVDLGRLRGSIVHSEAEEVLVGGHGDGVLQLAAPDLTRSSKGGRRNESSSVDSSNRTSDTGSNDVLWDACRDRECRVERGIHASRIRSARADLDAIPQGCAGSSRSRADQLKEVQVDALRALGAWLRDVLHDDEWGRVYDRGEGGDGRDTRSDGSDGRERGLLIRQPVLLLEDGLDEHITVARQADRLVLAIWLLWLGTE
jgi:hypothetical protein